MTILANMTTAQQAEFRTAVDAAGGDITARNQAMFAKFQRGQVAAMNRNPRDGVVYSGPLTITDRGTTAPAETSRLYPYSGSAPGVWGAIGGTPVLISGAWRLYSSAIVAGDKSTSVWRMSVDMNARYLTLRVIASAIPYRILVDGKYVSLTGTTLSATTGTALQFLLLDFATRGKRTVTLECIQSQAFAGGYTEATGALYQTDFTAKPSVSFLLDSYALSAGSTYLNDGLFEVAGDLMNARSHVTGSGGTGWATITNYRLDERIVNGDLALGGVPPELIVVGASINDRARDPVVIQANAVTGLISARQQYPKVPIVGCGCWPGAEGPSAGVIASENAFFAAIDQIADPLTVKVPISTDAAGAWITGTGKIGTTSGSGVSDWATVSDGIHLSQEGHSYAGIRLSIAILAALKAKFG